MTENILFSVIIPTFNRADALGRALDSLVLQTFQNFDVYVCDDGSTDHTTEIVDQYRSKLNINYIYDDNWGGPARPRNHGIKSSVGEWICFLDSDDWWYPTKLECCTNVLNKADVIYHDLDIYSIHGKNGIMKSEKAKAPIIQYLLVNGNKMPNSSVVIRKSIIDEIGLQLEEKEVISSEDYEFLLRASTITGRFCYIPKILGTYWMGDNISNDIRRHLSSEKKVVSLYSKYLNKFIENEIHYRSQYVMARYFQKQARYRQALKFYKNSIGAHTIKIKSKSILFFILCMFFSLVKQGKKSNEHV